MDYLCRTLPVIYPPINGFPHKGALFSILLAREECKPWVFSNFIQIYTLKDLHKNKLRSGTVDFFYNIYGDWTYFHLKANPWIKLNSMPFDFFRLLKTDVIDFIKTCIDRNMYLFFDIDMYYISAYKINYNKNHVPHETFIYGYDDDKKVLLMGDNTALKYNQDQITYDEIIKSTSSLLDIYTNNVEGVFWHTYREKSIFMLEVKKNVERNEVDPIFSKEIFDINTNKIINDLKEYLLLDNYADGYKYSDYYTYGIECYYELERFINYAIETNGSLDQRAFYSFIEHKKLMLLRMQYLSKDFELGELIEKYSVLVNKFNIIMNLVLKGNVTKQLELWERASNKLEECKGIEIILLNKFIEILSRKEKL